MICWMKRLPSSSRGCALPAKINCTGRFLSCASFTMLSNCWKISGAFVSGKAAREANGQRIGIQQVIEADEIALRHALVLEQQTAADEFNHLAPQFVAQRPKLFIGNKRR